MFWGKLLFMLVAYKHIEKGLYSFDKYAKLFPFVYLTESPFSGTDLGQDFILDIYGRSGINDQRFGFHSTLQCNDFI